jgi:hypothetical protein
MSGTSGKPNWKHMFSEITLRALLRLHHDYLDWSQPQESRPIKDQWLSRNPGVAFADELTVCGAIAQQFISSRLPSGHLVDGARRLPPDDDVRYWQLAREVATAKKSRCDLRLTRVDSKGTVTTAPPSLIEAKRLFIWTNHLDRPVSIACQLGRIQKDVDKLRKFIKARDGEFFGHILVWSVALDPRYKVPFKFKRPGVGTQLSMMPRNLLAKLDGVSKSDAEVRLWPLTAADPTVRSAKSLTVDSWLWTVLAEVRI